MTTYAPNFTPRWRGHYVAAGVQHAIQFRGPRGATFATMDGYRDRARELFANWASFLAVDFAWISSEVALTDEDLFNPATTPVVLVPGTLPVNTYSPVMKISALTFSGRAPGSRAKFSVFGLQFGVDATTALGRDGIITPAEASAISATTALAAIYFYANSGQLAQWHQRGTWKENDHLLKLVRRGIIA